MNYPDDMDPARYTRVQACFMEALELDEDELQWDSKILEDLGAESLDLLDFFD